jgi:hypothetical protein
LLHNLFEKNKKTKERYDLSIIIPKHFNTEKILSIKNSSEYNKKEEKKNE